MARALFTLSNDGNVGIGTTAPAGLLHLRVSSGALNTYYDGDGDKILWFRTASGTAQSEWKVDAAKTWITTRGTLPLKFGTNDTLALTIDGSTQAATFSGTVDITGNLQMGGINIVNSGLAMYNLESFKLADGKKAYWFGSSNDLEIYHDGSHSYISDQGAGYLRIKASSYLQLMALLMDEVICKLRG